MYAAYPVPVHVLEMKNGVGKQVRPCIITDPRRHTPSALRTQPSRRRDPCHSLLPWGGVLDGELIAHGLWTAEEKKQMGITPVMLVYRQRCGAAGENSRWDLYEYLVW